MSTFFVSLTTVIGLLTNQSQMIGFGFQEDLEMQLGQILNLYLL